MNLKNVLAAAVLLAAGLWTGCGHVALGVAAGPPPPPIYGPVGVAPGPGYAWNDGYYDLRGSRWYWVGGGWARRPYPNAVWDSPRWDRYHRGYRFHRGRWRHGRPR